LDIRTLVDTWFHDQFHDADNRGQPFVFDADALRDHIEDWQGKHKGADLAPERFGISQLASDYIDEKEKSVAHGTWETLRRAEKAFRAYEDATGDTITLDNFTTPDRARETVENLSEWLRTEYILRPSNGTTVVGWSANTLSRGLGHLATIIKWAAKRENIYVHTDRSVFSGLKSRVEKKDSISLSAADVDKLENVSIPEGTLRDQVRDMFVLACYHGQRFSDWRSIKPELYERDMQTIPQQKTKGHATIVHTPAVRRILAKYAANGLPSFVFDSVNGNVIANRYIKEVAELAGLVRPVQSIDERTGLPTERRLCELVTTHTGRRTAVTMLRNSGVPDHIIIKATGHSDVSMLRTYTRVSSETVAETILSSLKGQHDGKE
jgi:integrase